ncbi:MAG: hypothetical protein EGQ60_02980 [Clostridiales bacterium]|nr:hypothetical protein [Clostridiales bacterium]
MKFVKRTDLCDILLMVRASIKTTQKMILTLLPKIILLSKALNQYSYFRMIAHLSIKTRPFIDGDRIFKLILGATIMATLMILTLTMQY